MDRIPRVIDLVVNYDTCIGCGLCTYSCPNKALNMEWNEYGFLIPTQTGICESDGSCLDVCPFNPFPEKEVQTENKLSDLYLKDAKLYHPKVGRYNSIYAGYATEFRDTSSSGGLATFVMADLLDRGIISYVFSVKESSLPEVHYEYSISKNRQELLAASKTKYYPVTLSTVFSELDKLEGKIAVVGVACFIKAVRLTQYSNPSLKEKIPFLIGIICGGVKSRFFTEYLASKVGVTKLLCNKPEFRIKDICSTASDYSFGCIDCYDNKGKKLKMTTIGDMWGTGLFKANACDFCDDVTTELADISLGDAWLQPYVNDGKGTNICVTRSLLAEVIIKDGITSGKLHMEDLSLDRFLLSQKGSFNHRHKGIAFRIRRATQKHQLVPPKRYGEQKTSFDFKLVQLSRMSIRKKSLTIWKETSDAALFDKKMMRSLLILAKVTHLYHYKEALFRKIKKIFRLVVASE